MARPTKPKDIKPKALDESGAPVAGGGGGEPKLDLKLIITIVAIFVASIVGSAASVYFLAPMVVVPAVVEQVLAATTEGGGEHGGGAHAGPHQTVGMNLELDEFTVNLKSDPSLGGNQFLRTKMSLSIAVPPEEYCDPTGGHAQLPVETAIVDGETGIVAGAAASADEEVLLAAGGGGDPYAACQARFNQSMARFVPTMRDIINQSLMKRTAGTLGTIEGQEILKDDIKDQINHLMGDHYAVIRVNFSDFIIQY